MTAQQLPLKVPDEEVRNRLEELSTLYLTHLPATDEWRLMAIAQLLTKVLFGRPDRVPASVKTLGQELLQWSNAKVPIDLIADGLEYLVGRGDAEQTSAGWRLTDDGYERASAENAAHAQRVRGILDRRFPQVAPRERLNTAFNSICARFFRRYGTQVAATINRSTTQFQPPELLRDLIAKVALEENLGEYVEELHAGFRDLIATPSEDERIFLWCAWQSLFAARLVMTKIGADPIAVAELRNSVVYLDTNALLTLSIELREGNAAMRRLAEAMSQLGISLRVSPVTAKEYAAEINYRRMLIRSVWTQAPISLLRDSGDVFVRTALRNGHRTAEDVDRFMSGLTKHPTSLNGLRIEVVRDEDLLDASTRGGLDLELRGQIVKASSKTRREPKSDTTASHDAALTYLVEAHRHREGQAWVLTEDGSMCGLSARRTPKHQLPTWISSFTLLPLLAVDGEGPRLTADDCGGVLAAIFEHALHPAVDTYELTDVAALIEVEGGLAGLTDEQLREAAMATARVRLTGREQKKTDKAMRLEITRIVQRARAADVRTLEATKVELASVSADAAATKQREGSTATALHRVYMQQEKSASRWRFAGTLVGWILFAGGALSVGAWLIGTATSGDQVRVGVGGVVAALGSPAPVEIFRSVRRLRTDIAAASARAAERVVAVRG